MKKLILFTIFFTFLFSCRSENEAVSESTKTSVRAISARFSDNYPYLGAGYDITGDYANESSAGFQVIDVDKFKLAYPDRVLKEYPRTQNYFENYGENAEDYTSKLATTVNLKGSFFKKVLSVDFSSSLTNEYKFNGKYIYGTYNLNIKNQRLRFNASISELSKFLTTEFQNDLNTRTPEEIVRNYGTHVMVDIYRGAALSVKYESQTSNIDRILASRVGVKASILGVFDNVSVDQTLDTSSSNKNFDAKLAYSTRGGDPSKALVGTIDFKVPTSKIDISTWQNSSNDTNSVLVDYGPNGLVPLYEFVSDANIKANLKSYIETYLKNNSTIAVDYTKDVYRLKRVISLLLPSYNQYMTSYVYKFQNSFEDYSNDGVVFKVFDYKARNTVPIYCHSKEIPFSLGKRKGYSYSFEPTKSGYTSEGIAFFAYPTQQINTYPIHEYYSSIDVKFYDKNTYSQSNLPKDKTSNILPIPFQYYGIRFYAY